MSLSIVATVIAKPDHVNEVRQALHGMLAPSRAEPGCLQYDLHVDQDDPCRLVMIERWQDERILDAHLATPHFVRLQRLIEDKASSVEIRRLTPIA